MRLQSAVALFSGKGVYQAQSGKVPTQHSFRTRRQAAPIPRVYDRRDGARVRPLVSEIWTFFRQSFGPSIFSGSVPF